MPAISISSFWLLLLGTLAAAAAVAALVALVALDMALSPELTSDVSKEPLRMVEESGARLLALATCLIWGASATGTLLRLGNDPARHSEVVHTHKIWRDLAKV